jgi:hypothetical protein
VLFEVDNEYYSQGLWAIHDTFPKLEHLVKFQRFFCYDDPDIYRCPCYLANTFLMRGTTKMLEYSFDSGELLDRVIVEDPEIEDSSKPPTDTGTSNSGDGEELSPTMAMEFPITTRSTHGISGSPQETCRRPTSGEKTTSPSDWATDPHSGMNWFTDIGQAESLPT